MIIKFVVLPINSSSESWPFNFSKTPLSSQAEDFNILYFTCIEQHHRHSTGDGFVWLHILCMLYGWIACFSACTISVSLDFPTCISSSEFLASTDTLAARIVCINNCHNYPVSQPSTLASPTSNCVLWRGRPLCRSVEHTASRRRCTPSASGPNATKLSTYWR